MTRLSPFTLHRPESIEEATELLDRLGDDAVVYVGGTELFLLFKFGFARQPHVVDLKRIDELRGIGPGDGGLGIGAAETHRAIERDDSVRRQWPALAAMESGVGNLRVRTMGSIGGNLCFADPHSDPATFLLAADATLEARRGGSEGRRIPVREFVTGPFQNSLEPGELLTRVHVPALEVGAVVEHRKFVLYERPAVTVACHLRVAGGRLSDVRLAVGSAGIRAARAVPGEEALEGTSPDELAAALAEARSHVADAASPVADANGSVEYKRHIAGVLVDRCVAAAAQRATEGT